MRKMGPDASLRIAVMPAAAPTSVGWAVNQVTRRAPHVEVGIVRSWGASADFAALREGRFDAMVLVGPVDCPGLRASIITERERYAVVAADHPLAQASVLRLEDVIDCPTSVVPRTSSPGGARTGSMSTNGAGSHAISAAAPPSSMPCSPSAGVTSSGWRRTGGDGGRGS